jgi:polo-like kinase 1
MEAEWNELDEPYIRQWVDFLDKYGIGYILTNDSCGVYFNDHSKLLLHPDYQHLDYFEKGVDKVETSQSFTLKTYPPELKKKVTLVIHFKNYMEGN